MSTSAANNKNNNYGSRFMINMYKKISIYKPIHGFVSHL